MLVKKKIKVLVVDDSMMYREAIANGISKDLAIEVVATASDPFIARDKIIEFEPDVMTLDVEMPKMNGIEFLKRLMPQYPIPVVVVSSVSENVFDALNAGAVDFVTKPDIKQGRGLDLIINELVVKIKIASTAKLGHYKSDLGLKNPIGNVKGVGNDDSIIAIGASTGGTEALYSIIKQFPRDMPGVIVVQHMPPVFTRMFAERLNNSCPMEVREAKNGDRIEKGCVLIAPGEYHMRVKKSGSIYSVECFTGDKVNGHCPAVDVLFDSVAEKVADKAIGVILTGMGYDGAKGLLNMRRHGARTIGQDEESCVVYGMPKVAYEIGAVEKQMSLNAIPTHIINLLNSLKKSQGTVLN